MAHHDAIDHEAILESELILAQFADPLAGIDTHIAGRRLQVAPQYFHKGGLARAVGPDEAITIAIAKLDGNVFEQGLGPELHGDVGSSNQNLRPKNWSEKPYILRNFQEIANAFKAFSRDFLGFRVILYHCGFKISALLHENHLPGFRAAYRRA
jgi:hypothetical protein